MIIGPGGEPPLPEETTEPNSVPELCSLKPEISMTCLLPMPWKHWYYDTESGMCKKIHKGCIKNENKFRTKEDCEQTCKLSLPEVPSKCNFP